MAMNIVEFSEKVKDEIRDYLPDNMKDAEISVKEIMKNNDNLLHGLTIHPEDAGMTPIPTLYLENFLKDYNENGLSMNEILENIVNTYMSHMTSPEIDLSFVTEFDKAKEMILPRLINTESNQELLKERPNRQEADLSVIYAINLNSEMSVPITNSIMESWGVTEEQLNAVAIGNLVEQGPSFKSMGEVLREMMGDLPEEMLPALDEPQQMFVLTNNAKMHGAAELLNKEFMDELVKKFPEGHAILPSSIHEVLIIDLSKEITMKELAAMVCDVNSSQVAPEEVLSNGVYQYNAETHQIERADLTASNTHNLEREKEPEPEQPKPKRSVSLDFDIDR